jgi:hypothetical protein
MQFTTQVCVTGPDNHAQRAAPSSPGATLSAEQGPAPGQETRIPGVRGQEETRAQRAIHAQRATVAQRESLTQRATVVQRATQSLQ